MANIFLWCLTEEKTIVNNYALCFAYRDWVNKVDRARSRNTDAQESWKEGGEERSDGKNSWTDSGEPRVSSPGSVTQYIKTGTSQDYQVKGIQL